MKNKLSLYQLVSLALAKFSFAQRIVNHGEQRGFNSGVACSVRGRVRRSVGGCTQGHIQGYIPRLIPRHIPRQFPRSIQSRALCRFPSWNGISAVAVCLFLVMSFASGCATFRGLGGSGKREKTVSGVQGAAQGQWRGQALIRDRRAGKSVTLQLEIVAREPDRLRLEANGGLGALGAHVASIALNQGQVQAILTQERVFLIGSASSAAALRFLPIRLTPQELMFVLFDRQMPPQRPEWRCDLDGSGRPLICSREADAVNIRWHERTVDFRRIEISAPDVTMQVILEEAKTDLALSDDVFVLSAPANFRREVLDDQ